MENQNEPQNQEDIIQTHYYFASAVYQAYKPEFLDSLNKLCDEYLETTKKQQGELNEIYPVYMTDNFATDARIADFANYILGAAWTALESQGYAMNDFTTYFSEVWCQEHYKHSAMEQHVHGFGAQIVGFYFLDCPEKSPSVVFHDPKTAKIQLNLPETDITQATMASNMINYTPKPGLFLFTNAYVPHQFTRHADDKPVRFIHFNITALYNQQSNTTENIQNNVEIV